jgi:hypothetical protein
MNLLREGVDEEDYVYALMSDSAYNGNLVDSWERVYHSDNISVFKNNERIVMAYRGTVLKRDRLEPFDLLNDLSIAKGYKPMARIAEANTIRDLMIRTYSLPVTHVGHSLGGNIAKNVADANNESSVTFAKFEPRGFSEFFNITRDKKKQHKNYVVPSDLLSYNIGDMDSIFLKPKSILNPHSMVNFL